MSLFSLLLGSIVFIIGCSSNKADSELNSKVMDLQERVEYLEDENKELIFFLEQVNSLSINYWDYADKKRFVPRESHIYALPIEGFRKLNLIEANTVIEVFDAAWCQDQQLWLYVAVPVYDTPNNFKGWIPESETVQLTVDNIKLVQGDLFLREGTPIYEVDQFNEIKSTTATKISDDIRGRIKERQDSYVYFMSPGGWYFWVEEKYLIFPSVK